MGLRIIILLGSAVFSFQSQAFTCYATLVKDNCWKNYNVTVQILDTSNNNEVARVVVPKGQTWIRQKFACQPAQKLVYMATFTPIIWQSDAGKIYRAQRYWSLPEKIDANDIAWNIPICYPSEFSEVPLPPDAKGACRCDFKVVPALKAQ